MLYCSCDNVEFMIKNKVSFKRRKWKAIRCYHETLLKLLKNFPSQKTYSLLCKFAQQAGLTERYYNTNVFHDFLQKYKVVIEKAYSENERLADLLSQLLKESPL